MAEIDTSMYRNMQQVELPDTQKIAADSQRYRLNQQSEQENALGLQEKQLKQQRDEHLRGIMSSAVESVPVLDANKQPVLGTDGAPQVKPSLNKDKLLTGLIGGGFREHAVAFAKQFDDEAKVDAAAKAATEKTRRDNNTELNKQVAAAASGIMQLDEAKRPAAYKQTLERFVAQGMKLEGVPAEYDPDFVQSVAESAIDPSKRYELKNPKEKLVAVPGAEPGTMYNPADGKVTKLEGVAPKAVPLKIAINNKDKTITKTDADGNSTTDDMPLTPAQKAAVEGQTQSAVDAVKKARSDIDLLLTPPKGQPGLGSATGIKGKVGDLWSQATDSPTEAAIVRDRVKQVVATTTMNYMLGLKAAGLGVTAFDTDKAAEMLKNAAAQVTFKDPEETKRQLKAIRELGEGAIADANRARSKAGLEPIVFDQAAGSSAKQGASVSPTQKIITMAQIKQTASNYGKSVEQVMKDAETKGYVIR